MRRSSLFVPGNNLRMIEKASRLEVDSVVLDFEDSVAPREKVKCREVVTKGLIEYDWNDKEVGVRINGLDTDLWLDDLISAVSTRAQFILVPKIERPAEVQIIEEAIRYTARKVGRKDLPKILVIVENAKGLMAVESIIQASPLVDAIEFGSEDYRLSLGIYGASASETSVLYARSRVVAAASASSIDALDQAFVNLVDLDGLRASALQAKELGFTGKAVIHPNQIPIVNEVFTPSDSDVTWARKVLEGWKIAESEGRGAFRIDDKMVDIVHVKMAERILKTAKPR